MSNRIPGWSEVHARGASPRALALRDWFIGPEQRLGAQWHEPFVAGLAERLISATLDDCVYAGFKFDPVRRPLRGKVVGDDGCLAVVEFSTDDASTARHSAVYISWMDAYGTWVWVDGVALPVPSHEGCNEVQARLPLADPYATGWCEGRYFFIEIGGLDNHPRRAPSVDQRLGHVRGLLIHDADACVTRIEYPDDSQLWTSPRPVVERGELRVYPTRDEVAGGASERVIPLDRAFARGG
jgi:hypothetical protein